MGLPIEVNMAIEPLCHDIPLWYEANEALSKYLLSYNSQSAIAYNEPFGNK
jgi:hypothetical protein